MPRAHPPARPSTRPCAPVRPAALAALALFMVTGADLAPGAAPNPVSAQPAPLRETAPHAGRVEEQLSLAVRRLREARGAGRVLAPASAPHQAPLPLDLPGQASDDLHRADRCRRPTLPSLLDLPPPARA